MYKLIVRYNDGDRMTRPYFDFVIALRIARFFMDLAAVESVMIDFEENQ